MLKAILFDLGDTLFDFTPHQRRPVFEQAGRKAYQFLLDRGHVLPPFEQYFKKHYSIVIRSYLWSRLCGRDFSCQTLLCRMARRMGLKLDEPTLQELGWLWYQPTCDYTTVADHVVPTLNRLRDRGLKLAIVSNTFVPGYCLDRHMQMHGLLEFFPDRIYSSEIGYRKPHPAIFQAALDAVGVLPHQAVFIGDHLRNDIWGARRMGMRTIYRDPTATTGTHAMADFVIQRINELNRLIPHLNAPPLPQDLPLDADSLISEM